ncbi:MAG: putative membrane protein [Oceanicoccus sp.]|jgi:uncharacterized membrane protein
MKRFTPLLLIAAFLFWFVQPGTPVRGGQVSGADYLTLESVASADLDGSDALYESSTNFVSPAFEAPHEFQLLGLNWQQSLPAGTEANLEIRFQDNSGEWSDWEIIHEDNDSADQADMEEKWSYVITSNSVAFQYRASLSTDNNAVTPKLADIQFDYIDGGQPSKVEDLARLVFDDGDDVISRQEWGADESYLYASSYYSSDDPSEDDDEEELEFPELEIVDRLEKINGKDLYWAVEYPKDVDKIIIHHTASTKDLDDPEQLMRSIYAYHALSRGWGDIGYNYLVDSDGKIYEGRYGGDGAVAGHAAGYNTASVGIALLGNFEETPITADMMKGLMGLVFDQAVLHGIDPDGSSTFRGDYIPNIMGHRDVSATACPGDVTYEYLPELIEAVGKSLDTRRNMNFDDEYSYEEVGDHEMVSMGPEGEETVTIKIENTGSKRWNKYTFLTYNVSDEGIASIDKDSDKAIAYMKESSVEPGKTATFTFDVEAELVGGMTHFDLSPIFDGDEKTAHYMDLTVYVEQPMIEFKITDDDMPTLMKPGQSKTVTVEVKNEGNFTWLNDGDHPLVLKRSGSSTLTSDSTLAEMEEDEVKPGETATFSFKIKAPSGGGTHSLYVYPSLVDSNAYVDGTARLSTKTSDTEEDVDIQDMSEDLSFEPGESKYLWVELQNTSTEYWSNEAIGVSFDAASSVKISSAYMRVRSLPPGASAKLFFQLTAPSSAGTYNIEMMPTLDGDDLLDSEYDFDIEVSSTEVETSDYENAIRIKLTPDSMGAPVMTANGNFAVYGGDTLLQTFTANSRVFVTQSGSNYSLGSSKGRFLTDEPIRVVPEDGAVVQLMSMSQVPGWNTELNDNQFRGLLEIREDEGELIVINELPLEDYLKGIAEVSNDAHEEKAKTIIVLARSYAYYYMTEGEKFPGKPYHLDDDPDTSQKYLAYGFEQRSENIADYVEETEGQVVAYDGTVIKTPYFSQSAGYTMSAEDVWGWTTTPWLQGVQDPYCDATSFSGHGVGLSGCGATGMAEAGYSYEEIIDYYYQGIDLMSID